MPELDDIALLKQFAENDSEPAFAGIVSRHLNLVYSTAFRATGNAHAAQEISQAVFIILARKAKSLGAKTILSGWLHQTARLTAANYVRGEIRRQKREQETFMQSTLNETADETWLQIAPVLDDAISKLGAKDRDAIVLRFFENKSLGEVGAALGASEDAAKMRVNRALEKLRKFFTKRGVTFSAAAIAGAVSANSVQAAPVGLAKTISAVAITKGAAAGGSTLALVKGALKIMAWTKMKTAVAIGVAVIMATSMTAIIVKETFFQAIKEVYFQPNYQHFQNLPRGLFTLRTTHFTTPEEGLDYSGETSSLSGEHVTLFMGRNRSFEQLINKAYGGSQPYTVFPVSRPKSKFDYLCTILDSKAGEHLQTAIKKKLGYIAIWQQRDTDVFLLKVQKDAFSGLKPASLSNNSETWRDSETRLEFRNRSLWSLANEIQNVINMPVLDQTGRTDALDFDLNCTRTDLANRNWDSIDQALGRLGLELVPTNMPIEMLVVEKVK